MNSVGGMTIVDVLEGLAELPRIRSMLEQLLARDEQVWPEALSLEQAARYVGCSRPTFKKHFIDTGEIPTFTVGTDTKVRRATLDEWLELHGGLDRCQGEHAARRESTAPGTRRGRPPNAIRLERLK